MTPVRGTLRKAPRARSSLSCRACGLGARAASPPSISVSEGEEARCPGSDDVMAKLLHSLADPVRAMARSRARSPLPANTHRRPKQKRSEIRVSPVYLSSFQKKIRHVKMLNAANAKRGA